MSMIVKIKGKEYNLEKAVDVKLYADYEDIDKNDLVYSVYRDIFIRGFLVITGKKQGKIVFCRPTLTPFQNILKPFILSQNILKPCLLEDVPIETINILKKYGKIQKLWDFMIKTIMGASFIISILGFVSMYLFTSYDSWIGSIVCGCVGLCCLVLIPVNCYELYNKELYFVHKS